MRFTTRDMRRVAIALVFAVALSVCAAAYAENYTFKRTAAGDKTVGALTLVKADFPTQFRFTGGRVKPDESPNSDSCNGYTPKERDLVVVGDAQSDFHNPDNSVVVDSQVQLFRAAAMTAVDVQRSLRMLSAACQAQVLKQEHVQLVRFLVLGRPRCTCDFAITMSFETKTSHPGLNSLLLITFVRKGPYEASLYTNVGKSTTNAQHASAAAQTALIVQGVALKALLKRLHA